MDIALLIRHRLNELALEQKDLAAAAQVTESYISQLLARKKLPPAPERTDLYERIGAFLRLPSAELSRLALLQRQEEIRRRTEQPARPLFRRSRELLLERCHPARRDEVRRIFEKEPFGVLERLVTQKLVEASAGAEQTGFEGANFFNVSVESRAAVLEPLIEAWDIDLKTFTIEFVLRSESDAGRVRRFAFAEQKPEQPRTIEPGFRQFLEDSSLSGDATAEELEFLGSLVFKGRRPGPLYYYRELQNVRDPLHFPVGASKPLM